MRYSCLAFVTAFGLLPFTPSDPRKAFVTVLQQVPELAQYFTSRITRQGREKLFVSYNRCPVVGFIPPVCRHHDIHADVPVLHILALYHCVPLFMYPMPTCQHAGLIHSPLCFVTVACLCYNTMAENHENELHLEILVQTESISQFLMEFEFPNVLEDYRCTVCHRLGNKRENMMITVPAPYLVFHKIGGGDVQLEQHIENNTASLTSTCREYFYSVFQLAM